MRVNENIFNVGKNKLFGVNTEKKKKLLINKL